MEIFKAIFLFLLIIISSNCKNKTDEEKNEYIPIFEDVLFKDNTGNIFIKINNAYFSDDIAILNNESILKIKNIIDVNTFKRIKNTSCYFYDKNKVYALQGDKKASFPKFIEININFNKLMIIDSLTIKDDSIKCVEGFCSNIYNDIIPITFSI